MKSTRCRSICVVAGSNVEHGVVYSKVTTASSRYLRRSSVPVGHIMVSVYTTQTQKALCSFENWSLALWWLLIGSLTCLLYRWRLPQLDGPHQYLYQRRPQMHQAQGSAGQTGDDHHRERRQSRPVDQGEVKYSSQTVVPGYRFGRKIRRGCGSSVKVSTLSLLTKEKFSHLE